MPCSLLYHRGVDTTHPHAAEPGRASLAPVVPIHRRATHPGLSTAGRAAARAFAEALWSKDGEHPPEAHRLDFFEADLADFVGHLNPRARLLFRACLATVTWVAPLIVGRPGRLAGLPVPARIRAIERLERTPASLALFATKAVVSLIWYEHPDSARDLGWDKRCKTGA